MQQEDLHPAPQQQEVCWRFGLFQVWEGQRRIDRGGQEVRVGSRSFELLLQLIAQLKCLEGWYRYAQWFDQGLQLRMAADKELHARRVRQQLATYDAPCKEMLVTFCTEWLDDQVIARVANGEGLWCAAEVWRAAGWREERRNRPVEAEQFYLRAIDIAQRQAALSWELRAAGNLARLLRRLDQDDRAIVLLTDVCERAARAGSDTRELEEARALRLCLTCP